MKKFIRAYQISLYLNYLHLEDILKKLKKKIIKKPFVSLDKPNIRTDKEMLNVKLHASCLIFSRYYIEHYEGIYPKTFLYLEENILYFIAQRDALTTIYYPKVQIYHKEDSSTNFVYKKDYQKRRLYYKCFIQSAKAFIELIESSNAVNS